MEQVSGLAWITGHPWDQPRIQRGPSDPNAGMHAAFALVVGLARRDATGTGQPLRGDDGRGRAQRGRGDRDRGQRLRQPARARRQPRPARRAAGPLPVRGLRPLARGLGRDRRAVARRCAPRSASRRGPPIPRSTPTPAGARSHDVLDDRIAEWCADRDADEAAALPRRRGRPGRGTARPAARRSGNPQFQHRGFHEAVDHPSSAASSSPRCRSGSPADSRHALDPAAARRCSASTTPRSSASSASTPAALAEARSIGTRRHRDDARAERPSGAASRRPRR